MNNGIKCVREGCQYSGKPCALWNDCIGFLVERNNGKDSFRITEDEVQEAVVEFCDLVHVACVHIPNESKRSQAYGAKMKRMGLRKGFPDLFLPMARKGFHGLFIELKRDRHSPPTKEQLGWIDKLNKEGYRAVICHGIDETIAEIKDYTGIK